MEWETCIGCEFPAQSGLSVVCATFTVLDGSTFVVRGPTFRSLKVDFLSLNSPLVRRSRSFVQSGIPSTTLGAVPANPHFPPLLLTNPGPGPRVRSPGSRDQSGKSPCQFRIPMPNLELAPRPSFPQGSPPFPCKLPQPNYVMLRLLLM